MLAETDDGELFFDELGSGSPLLLIHGATLDADSLRPLASQLSDRFRCIMMDRPGYERSYKVSADMTIDQLVSSIRAVHQASTDRPVWLFGHSSGGNFALAYATRYPDAVEGLILMEPALYDIFSDDEEPNEVASIKSEILPQLRKGEVKRALEAFGDIIDANVPESWEQFAQLPIANHDNSEVFRYELPIVVGWCPSRSELALMSKPTLVIEGDLTGPLLRSIAGALVDRLPDGNLFTLNNCDHAAPVLRPEAVAEEIYRFVV